MYSCGGVEGICSCGGEEGICSCGSEEAWPPVWYEEPVWEFDDEPRKEVYPPVWKSIKESPQFKCGMLQPYLCHWPLEDVDHIDDSEFPPVSAGPWRWQVKDSHKNLKRFLQQVRESRGYDVDCTPPAFAGSPFHPVQLQFVTLNPARCKTVKGQLTFALKKINAQAQRHGERYRFVELKKVVEAGCGRTNLFTFTVKEVASTDNVVKTVQAMVTTSGYVDYTLEEWRFKPEFFDALAISSGGPSGRSGDAIQLV